VKTACEGLPGRLQRFKLTLDVRYSILDRSVPAETGTGRTIDMSSSGLRFNADRPLRTGQRLDVSIDWPVLLDGGVQLQLILAGVVVRCLGTETALRIQRHEFRTRRVRPYATLRQEVVA
jgi:hypothetical protein